MMSANTSSDRTPNRQASEQQQSPAPSSNTSSSDGQQRAEKNPDQGQSTAANSNGNTATHVDGPNGASESQKTLYLGDVMEEKD